MYLPFQDAQFIPIQLQAGNYAFADSTVPKVDGIAAKGKDGNIWLALTNIDPNNAADISAKVPGIVIKGATGKVLTAARVDAVNSFDSPETVSAQPASVRAENGKLTLHLLPKSVTVMVIDQ